MTNQTFRPAGALSLAAALLGGTAALAQTSGTVAFLMPDQASTRYEEHDFPGFKAEMEKLCPDCTVDLPERQRRRGAAAAAVQLGARPRAPRSIVLDPVDSAAAASLVQLGPEPGRQGHRLRPADPRHAGRLLRLLRQRGRSARRSPRAWSQHLKATGVADGHGRRPADQRLADRRGRRPDPRRHPRGPRRQRLQDAGRVRHARLGAAQGAGVGERPDHRASATEIVGVVAANDGTGGGAIAAFKAAGVDPVPPVTGNDATIAALQLIIAGDQYNTISKPSEIVGRRRGERRGAVPRRARRRSRRRRSTTRRRSSSCRRW